MKKLNKFLLTLGSVSSLAALPLIAANCGGTKNEESKPTTPKEPKTPNADDPAVTPSTPKDNSKLNELKKQTEDLVKDLESKIEKVKKAKFDK
ncbi:variable surface lipoprotein, partial [Metamycoplasma auris]